MDTYTNDTPAPSSSTSMLKQPWLWGLSGLLIGVLLTTVGIAATNKQQAANTTTTLKKTVVLRPQVTKVEAATSLDATGSAVKPTEVFTKSDKTIYVVAALKNVPKGAKLEYVRYLNGKYLDSKIATTTKDNAQNFSFSWTAKPGTPGHLVGTYMVKVYLNGNTQEAIAYIVQ